MLVLGKQRQLDFVKYKWDLITTYKVLQNDEKVEQYQNQTTVKLAIGVSESRWADASVGN